MKLITIIITTIISLGSSGGLILNNLLANLIKSHTESIEKLEVRVSNIPSYKIINGQAKSIKIATRGLELRKNVRIETLELETDSLNIDLQSLNSGKIKDFRQALKQPLQGGLRLVLTEKDLNETLQSPEIQSYLQKLISKSDNSNYEIINPRLNLLDKNKIGIDMGVNLLNQNKQETLNITLEFGLEVIRGHKIKIIEPKGTLNGRQLSNKLLQGFADNINFDCQSLETSGITLRILELEINDNEINLAAFGRLTNNN